MSTTDTAHAKKIDADLAAMFTEANRLHTRADSMLHSLMYRAGARTIGRGKFNLTPKAALDKLTADANGGRPQNRETHGEAVQGFYDTREAAKAATAAANTYENEHYTGWSRFFLVTDGHIHGSRHCSSLRITTALGWLPELSGETEEDAVAAHGPLLCTKCFPSAPVAWTIGKESADDTCPGSGTFINRDLPHRTGYYSGNWATCPECDARPSLSSLGKLRKHKAPKE